MAIAIAFNGAGDRGRITWFTVQDDKGKIWRYDRTESEVDPSAAIDVRCGQSDNRQTLAFVRGDDGRPILQQQGDGLPEKIIVGFDDPIKLSAVDLAEFAQNPIRYN